MRQHRMFSLYVIDSDAFLDMPLSAQALYLHLCMRADDDGFINNAKRIQRTIGASEDDLKLLVAKQFVIPFETGVIVIRHWKIHNIIRKDMYKPSLCTEKGMIDENETGLYQLRNEPVTSPYRERNESVPGTLRDRDETVTLSKSISISKSKDKLIDIKNSLQESRLSDPLKEKLEEWLQYKTERRESYKPTGLKSLITQTEKAEQTHGTLAVINQIDAAMSSGWKGIGLERIAPQKRNGNDILFDMAFGDEQ